MSCRSSASSADIRLTAVVEVAGTGAPNPYAGKHLPHYTSGKVQSVPDDEWATLLGARVARAGKVKIDRNMTLGRAEPQPAGPLSWLIWLVLTALLNAFARQAGPECAVPVQHASACPGQNDHAIALLGYRQSFESGQ